MSKETCIKRRLYQALQQHADGQYLRGGIEGTGCATCLATLGSKSKETLGMSIKLNMLGCFMALLLQSAPFPVLENTVSLFQAAPCQFKV